MQSLIGRAVVTIFPEFLGKCRSWALLNEIAQKFTCKMCIIRSNNYIFWVCIAELEALVFCFSGNTSDNCISASIAWNLKKKKKK